MSLAGISKGGGHHLSVVLVSWSNLDSGPTGRLLEPNSPSPYPGVALSVLFLQGNNWINRRDSTPAASPALDQQQT